MVANNSTSPASVITLTEAAANEVKHLRTVEKDAAGKALRFYVEKGGCSGLKYSMVFDEQRDGDAPGEFFGASVLVDAFSADYLRGCVVDFSDSLTDGGFKITNPNASQSCGCGRSFESPVPAIEQR